MAYGLYRCHIESEAPLCGRGFARANHSRIKTISCAEGETQLTMVWTFIAWSERETGKYVSRYIHIMPMTTITVAVLGTATTSYKL
jgi:hypothetical protein